MNPLNQQIQDLTDQVLKLKRDLEGLQKSFFLNSFPSRQDFNKYCSFNTTLKVPHYSSAPSSSNVGEIIEVAGVLYISTATDTFTKVGSQ